MAEQSINEELIGSRRDVKYILDQASAEQVLSNRGYWIVEYAQQSSSARGIGRPMGPWVVRLGEGFAATDLMFLCYGELPAYFDWLFQVKGGGIR